MSKVSVFDHGWIDLVFEGRNKSYGAYQLRQQDSKTTITALISGIVLIGILVCIPVISNYFTAAMPTITDKGPIIVVHEYIQPLPPKENKPEPVQKEKAAAAASSEKKVEFKPLDVVPATTAPAVLPDKNDFVDANPGNHTDAGDNKGNISLNGGSSTGTDTTATGNDEGTLPDNSIVTMGGLDVKPAFPGGIKKFYELVSNKISPPASEAGKVKMYVYFVVEKDGAMTNIKVTNKTTPEMEREAIRVLKSIRTKWEPGFKNGKAVRTAYSLPITINVN